MSDRLPFASEGVLSEIADMYPASSSPACYCLICVEANVDHTGRHHGFLWRDAHPEEKRHLLGRLAAIAREEGIAPTLCGQPKLVMPGLGEASCIDAGRLADVAQHPIEARERQRPRLPWHPIA
jgi:hypothetical protein